MCRAEERALSGRKLRVVDQRHDGRHLRGADVRQQPRAVFQRPRRPGQQLQLDVEHLSGADRLQRARRHQRRAARRVRDFDAGEVGGRALSRARLLDRRAVDLHAPYSDGARLCSGADEVDLVAGRQRAGEEGAGHHRAESFDCKRSIERQKQRALLGPRLLFLDRIGDRFHQLGQAAARSRRTFDDRRLLEESALHQLAQLEHE